MRSEPENQGRPPRAGSWITRLLLLAIPVAGGAWYWQQQDPRARFEQACAAYDRGDLSKVREEAQRLRRIGGYAAEVALLNGMVDLSSGRYPNAVMVLEPAREAEQTRARAWLLTGEAFYRIRQLHDARLALQTAIDVDADNAHAQRLMAATLYDLGASGPALLHLEKLSQLDPEDPRPGRMSGLIYKDYDRYADAVAAYRESLDRDDSGPQAEDVRLELAECLIQLREYEDALQVVEDCEDGHTRWNLEAQCALALGRLDEAQRLVAQALDRAPDDPAGLKLQAELLMANRDYAPAVSILERAAAADPSDATILMQLSQAYRLLGDVSKADTAQQEMQRLRDLRTRLNELHEQALGDTSNADLRFQIGEAALALGKPLIARMWFEAALALAPQHLQARQELTKLMEADQNSAEPATRPTNR